MHQNLLLAVTHPTPNCLAFSIARFIQKLPTTGPRVLRPSTSAVENLSLTITGVAFPSQIAEVTS